MEQETAEDRCKASGHFCDRHGMSFIARCAFCDDEEVAIRAAFNEAEADIASRQDWLAAYNEGLELLGFKPAPDILSVTRDIARGT